MASQLSQLLDRIEAVLVASVPAGTGVHRDRADAVSLEEAPCVNLLVRDGQTEPFARETDVHEIQVAIRIYVRAEEPSRSAELIHEAFHQPLVTDAQISAIAHSCRLSESSFDLSEADSTSLIKEARYRLKYSTPSTSI